MFLNITYTTIVQFVRKKNSKDKILVLNLDEFINLEKGIVFISHSQCR